MQWPKIFFSKTCFKFWSEAAGPLLATQGSLPLSLCWKRRWLPVTATHDLLDLRPETKDHHKLRTKKEWDVLATKVQAQSGEACHSPAASLEVESIDPSELAKSHHRKEPNSLQNHQAGLPPKTQDQQQVQQQQVQIVLGLPPNTQHQHQVQQVLQLHQEYLQEQGLQQFWRLSKLQLPSSCAHHHWHQQKLIWPFPSAWRRSIDSDWWSPSSSWIVGLLADPDESHSRSPSSSWRPQASQGRLEACALQKFQHVADSTGFGFCLGLWTLHISQWLWCFSIMLWLFRCRLLNFHNLLRLFLDFLSFATARTTATAATFTATMATTATTTSVTNRSRNLRFLNFRNWRYWRFFGTSQNGGHTRL